jgi:hypothetical protein
VIDGSIKSVACPFCRSEVTLGLEIVLHARECCRAVPFLHNRAVFDHKTRVSQNNFSINAPKFVDVIAEGRFCVGANKYPK